MPRSSGHQRAKVEEPLAGRHVGRMAGGRVEHQVELSIGESLERLKDVEGCPQSRSCPPSDCAWHSRALDDRLATTVLHRRWSGSCPRRRATGVPTKEVLIVARTESRFGSSSALALLRWPKRRTSRRRRFWAHGCVALSVTLGNCPDQHPLPTSTARSPSRFGPRGTCRAFQRARRGTCAASSDRARRCRTRSDECRNQRLIRSVEAIGVGASVRDLIEERRHLPNVALQKVVETGHEGFLVAREEIVAGEGDEDFADQHEAATEVLAGPVRLMSIMWGDTTAGLMNRRNMRPPTP